VPAVLQLVGAAAPLGQIETSGKVVVPVPPEVSSVPLNSIDDVESAPAALNVHGAVEENALVCVFVPAVMPLHALLPPGAVQFALAGE
jgi:hypothetical protein